MATGHTPLDPEPGPTTVGLDPGANASAITSSNPGLNKGLTVGLDAGLDRRLAPVNLANQDLLAVPEAVSSLFPAGGLQRGWSVGFDGPGGWSLSLAMLGAAVGEQGWVACVGLEELGLVAGGELGLRLDRVIMIETPAPDQWATVIAALVEVVDVVCLGPTPAIGIRDARRLMARAREQDTVLFHLTGGRSWPQALDVTLEVEPGSWSGVGAGYGYLQSRSASVIATGRRSMARTRRCEVLLPGPDGGLCARAAAPISTEAETGFEVEAEVGVGGEAGVSAVDLLRAG